jgi:hypothetical protein
MNIEDKGSTTSWTNTTSAGSNSTANETWPWYRDHSDWFDRLPNGSYGRQPLHNVTTAYNFTIQPNTPVFNSATGITSDQPGTQTWPMWMFGTVAGVLTFGSIILPLVAGPVYRSIARFAIRWPKTFRLTVTLLWLPYVITYSTRTYISDLTVACL